MRLRLACTLTALAFLGSPALAAPAAVKVEPPATYPLALNPFTFEDTSGEVRDQTADHDRRLADFVSRLKEELGTSGKFEFGDAPCADNQCRPADTLAKARAEGKPLVVFGMVQKTSTLILWAKVDVVSVKTEKPIFTRWITFRGDTDEAWQRTARYIGRAMNKAVGG